MSFNKKVVKLLKDKKKTKAQLAKAAGIPYTTLDSMLKRDSDASRLATIYKIADYLDVSVEELVFDDPIYKRNKKAELTDTELDLIENYRAIDERGRGAVNAIVDFEVARIKPPVEKTQPIGIRKIPIYMSPAAAGEPLPILADDYSMVRTEAPDEASFGIRISGDSMEPVIPDASVAWVVKQESINSGEVGIFVLNGESLCKKLDFSNGVCTLVSFNPKYKPIEVLESDDLRVVGRVIL